jgi:hypothetical protein
MVAVSSMRGAGISAGHYYSIRIDFVSWYIAFKPENKGYLDNLN